MIIIYAFLTIIYFTVLMFALTGTCIWLSKYDTRWWVIPVWMSLAFIEVLLPPAIIFQLVSLWP